MNFNTYYALIKPYADEQIGINRENNFSKLEDRSKEDQTRFKELTEIMNKIQEEFDLSNPVSPCPECNGHRKASCDSFCFNPECSQAKLMGGMNTTLI